MKKALLGLLLSGIGIIHFASAQTVVFHEDFESPSLGDSVSSVGTPTWTLVDSIRNNGVNSYGSNPLNIDDTTTLVTNAFPTVGMSFVELRFTHVCKIEFFDFGIIEVSPDSGQTWIKIGGADYLGASLNYSINPDSAFNVTSYSSVWLPGSPTQTPDDSWFQFEQFDVSKYLGDVPNAMIRFKLYDGNSTGANGNYGWLIDDIEVEVAPCELIPPAMTINNAPSGIVYNAGPYNVNVDVTDDSGVDTVYVVYSINSAPNDTIGLGVVTPDNYAVNIPSLNQGDTVCYKIVAVDASNCANMTTFPLTGETCFRFADNIPVPYFTNFDSGTDWVSTFQTNGSEWQFGTPTYGATNAPFSAPNAWDVNTGSAYGPNGNTSLTTRAFNFSGITGPTLSFQLNYNTQTQDGAWLEYSTDSVNWTTLGSVGAPNTTNWYNVTNINGSRSGWSGSSGGFVKASIRFNDADNFPAVFFRFRFVSNGFSQLDGVTIDDFSIIPPPPFDGALTNLYNPGGLALANKSDSVRVRVKNVGLELLDTIQISYVINGAPPVTFTAYDTIVPGDARIYNLGGYTAVLGANSFCAYLEIPQDTNQANDTICRVVTGVEGDTIPYFDNFDTGSTFMPQTTSGSVWQLGTPTFPAGLMPYSAPNSWDINLTSGYGSNANTKLTTQVFGMGGVSNPEISFWYNSQTQLNRDGVYLEYTLDGQSWQVVGSLNDPLGENWNPTNILTGNKPGWSGNSNGWKQAKVKVPELSNVSGVQFRFVFVSDFLTQLNGFTIDDFRIGPPPPFDVELIEIVSPQDNGCALSANEPFIVRIANVGSAKIDSIPLGYRVNADPPVIDTLFSSLAPGDTFLFTFSQPVDLSMAQTNYNMDAWVAFTPDTFPNNDTIFDLFIRNDKLTAPHFEDFEGFGLGSPGTFINGWEQSSSDTWDWTVHQGGTTSGSTGPSGDHTTGSGIYLYTETSGAGSNKIAIIQTSCVDLTATTVPRIEFWRHMYGATMGTLNLDVQDNTGTWNNVWSLSGDQGDLWIKETVDLTGYGGQFVKLRFRAETGTSFTSDMAIDDVYIYEPQPFDGGVVQITAPDEFGCDLSASETVSVLVSNFGTQVLSPVPMAYSVNGGQLTLDTLFASLAPGDTLPFTFSVPVDLSAQGVQMNLLAYTNIEPDTVNTNNDTTAISLINQALPYTETFDAFGLGDPGDLLNGWIQDDSDQGNWRVHSGGTPSFNTGPTNDHTPGAGGNYMYIEANDYFNSMSNLLSPCLDLSTLTCPKLTFYYHMFGTGMGTMTLEILDENGNWNFLWSQSGNQGNQWNEVELVLGDYVGQIVKLRFSGQTTFSTIGDMAIDDVTIEDTPPLDAESFSIATPFGQSAGGTDVFPELLIRNAGCDTLTNMDVAYSVNGGTPVVEPFTGALTSGNTTLFTFATPYVSPTGTYELCMWIIAPTDTNQLNDTICENILGVPVHPVEYCTNFDGPNDGFQGRDGFEQWERGTPGGNTINTALSAPNVWITNRTAVYQNNSNDNLYTPIFDITGALDPEFHMDIWYDTENNWDGARVDYSTDDGKTWQTLGSPGSIGSQNWYTSTSLISTQLPGWEGSSGGWVHVSHPLGFLNGVTTRVQFRINFSSDGSVQGGDGVAIDNLCIIVPIQNSAGSVAVGASTGGLVFPGPNQVVAEIVNSGVRRLGEFTVTLDVDNGAFTVVDTVVITNPIANLAIYEHTFSQLWNATEGKHDICIYTSRPNDTLDGLPEDDTLCASIVVFDSVNTVPYCNDFEDTTKSAWATLSFDGYTKGGTIWVQGDPRKPNLNSPYSGTNCWATGISGVYGKAEKSALFTPLFTIDTAKCYEVSFFHQFLTEKQHDGGTFLYSQDRGLTWKQVGYAFEPDWFNTPWITGIPAIPPVGGWTGNSNGWGEAKHLVQFNSPEPVIFVFRFASDVTLEDEGWLVDDFCFQEFTGNCIISVEEDLAAFNVTEPIPNPANVETRFDLSLPFAGEVLVEVTNVLGETTHVERFTAFSGENSYGLNTQDLPAGLYQVRFVFDGESQVRNLSIAR